MSKGALLKPVNPGGMPYCCAHRALNNLIKLANKNGRGFKFDVLIAKVLFNDGNLLLGGKVMVRWFHWLFYLLAASFYDKK